MMGEGGDDTLSQIIWYRIGLIIEIKDIWTMPILDVGNMIRLCRKGIWIHLIKNISKVTPNWHLAVFMEIAIFNKGHLVGCR